MEQHEKEGRKPEQPEAERIDTEASDPGESDAAQFAMEQFPAEQLPAAASSAAEQAAMEQYAMELPDEKRRDIASAMEGILFASGEALPLERLIRVLEISEREMEEVLRELESHYNDGKRGIRLLRVEGSVQLCSAPEHAEAIRQTLEKRRIPQLSAPALEVLAVIAYFQPVTRAYIERVRGVDSSYTVSTLLNRGLIEPCGHLQVPGRPALFRTTKAFLRSFGLTELKELPPLPEAEEEGEVQAQLQEAIAAIQRQQEAEEEERLTDSAEEQEALRDQGQETAEAAAQERETAQAEPPHVQIAP